VTTGGDGYFVQPGVGKKFERDPDRPVLVKASGEDTGGAFAVLEETVGPGGGGPLHVHRDSDELIYVLEGEFRFRIGEQLTRGTAGTLAFVPKGVAHNWQNIARRPGRMLFILQPAGFEKCLEEISGIPVSQRDLPTLRLAYQRYGADVLGPRLPPIDQS
jgi:quercetin dioxygenase-like cupin family protein